MNLKNECWIAILAGGKSTRMHTDKAELLWEGKSLLERTVNVAALVCPKVLVVGRAMPNNWPEQSSRFLPDAEPGLGPIGGLITALRQAAGHSVLALAVDFPLLNEAALWWLYDQVMELESGKDGIAVHNAGQPQPLFSVYTASCLALAETSLQSGKRSLQSIIYLGEFLHVTLPPEHEVAIVNVNTTEELDNLRAKLST